jgi:succinate-acetate transporter protein
MLLQFHNVGWCDVGPVVSMAFIFGGLAQMIAGYQEFKCGNNFGYSAFVSYGAFWIALGIIFLLNHFNIYHSSTTDVGWFLVAWTIYTAIMWIPAMRIHGAMAVTFTLLLIGFILLGMDGLNICGPNPERIRLLKKLTYIYRVPDQDVFVGAGVYVGGMIY